MKLTQKDKDFLERLRQLLDAKDLKVEMKNEGYKRLVLRQNYGDKIEVCFRMSRQGIRWRFGHIFNEIYIAAYETIYMVESNFGTGLRQEALAIAKERVEMRIKIPKMGTFDSCRREKKHNDPDTRDPE
jgi:hypothetical protein